MKIYKLTCNDLTYYGSTSQTLAQRKAEHHYAYKHFKRNISSSSIYGLAEKIGVKIKIELVEEIDGTKDDLRKLEQWYIRNNQCVNINFNK